ncbi:MAG: PaaI family thioesterase [Pseudobdellovibrio sp.]
MSNHLQYDPQLYVTKPYPGDAEGSFVLGTDSDVLQTVLQKSDIHHELNGCVWFGYKTAGPPGHVHGGCQAALLDEMMGSTAWHWGYKVVAAKIEVEFLEMVPYKMQYNLKGRITQVDKRKVSVEAELSKGEKIFARSKGLFIILKDEQLTHLNIEKK